MYNVLGVNPGHNGSVALVSDGEVVYYTEEERLSRIKYDANPFLGILEVLQNWEIHEVVLAGTGHEVNKLPWTGDDPYTGLVRKYYPKAKRLDISQEHHMGHTACAFYNSGFKEAIAIIVDGSGSVKSISDRTMGYECESIWHCSYPNNFKLLHRIHGSNMTDRQYDGVNEFNMGVTITKSYEAVSNYLGFCEIDAGKTMGLAPYGKHDPNMPELFYGHRANMNVFMPHYPSGAWIDTQRVPYLQKPEGFENWVKDPSKLTEQAKNLAYMIQMATQEKVGNLIEYAVKSTGITDIVIAGGYGLNCVANYYFRQRFPNINIYQEPIAHDGGTSIGAAKLGWHNHTGDKTIRKQDSIYYGKHYTLEEHKEVLNDYKEHFNYLNAKHEDVAKIIESKQIVALFQGRSEAGPRALGNRSILYNPIDPNGKDFVNKVKGREWFRPFAGSVLKEHVHQWFDLRGLDETPFMMYAVDVHQDRKDIIPSIIHVDGTCRIQTVTEKQNSHYYKLISEFYKLSGIPMLFNTSFNLGGEPLVETLNDALKTVLNCDINYLYLPEFNLLIEKK